MTNTKIITAINNINTKLREQLNNRYSFWSFLKLEICQDVYRVSLAGVTLWKSDSDEFEQDIEDDIESYLREQVNKLIMHLSKIKV